MSRTIERSTPAIAGDADDVALVKDSEIDKFTYNYQGIP